MTAHDRDQADTDAGEDEGWVSLSESPSGPLTPPSAAAEGRTAPPSSDAEDDDGWVSLSESPSGPLTPPSAAAEGRTAPPPPDAEDDGWVSVPSGTPRPSGPAPPRPARVRETEVALRFTGLGGQLLLNRGQTVRLGRSRSWATPEAAEILADESTVSGRHASVEYAEDGTVWLTEVAEGSTNGIRVNRHQVLTPGQALRLRTGDMVWLGPHVTFLVRGGALPVPDTPADGTGQHPDG